MVSADLFFDTGADTSMCPTQYKKIKIVYLYSVNIIVTK